MYYSFVSIRFTIQLFGFIRSFLHFSFTFFSSRRLAILLIKFSRKTRHPAQRVFLLSRKIDRVAKK